MKQTDDEFHGRTKEESLEHLAAYERVMGPLPNGLSRKQALIWIALIGTMSNGPIPAGVGSAAITELARLLKDEAEDNQASSSSSSSSDSISS